MTETLKEFLDTLEDDLARGSADRAPLKRAVQSAIRYYQKDTFWFTERRLGRLSANSKQHWYGTLGLDRRGSYQDCEQCNNCSRSIGRTYLDTENEQLCYNRNCKTFQQRISSGAGDFPFGADAIEDTPWSFDEPWVEGRVTDIVEINRVWDLKQECSVPYVAYSDFYEDYGSEYYTLYGGEMGFGCPRDTTYLISGTFRPFMPQEDGDTTVFFTEAYEMIYAKTRSYFSRNTMQDFNESANWEAIANNELKKIKSESAIRKPPGKIKPHGLADHWDHCDDYSDVHHGIRLRDNGRRRW